MVFIKEKLASTIYLSVYEMCKINFKLFNCQIQYSCCLGTEISCLLPKPVTFDHLKINDCCPYERELNCIKFLCNIEIQEFPKRFYLLLYFCFSDVFH